jgi:hypothetical protein
MKVTWGVSIVAVGTICLSVAAAASGTPVSWAGAGVAQPVTAGVRPPAAGDASAIGAARPHWGRAIEVPGGRQVTSMSCAAAGYCTAAGFSEGSGLSGFVISERHGRWGRPVNEPGIGLWSVSCGSAGNCSGVGTNGDNQQGYMVSELHGRWGPPTVVPGLAALNTGDSAFVWQVSCASAGNCAAGGDYTESGNTQLAFVVSEKNGRWGTAIEVPGLAALETGGFAEVLSVSCASVGNCAAGGYYNGGQGFVVGEWHGRWATAIEVPGAGRIS